MGILARLIASIVPGAVVLLLARWGMNVASPAADMRRVQRLVGWCERGVTQLDALATRIVVLFTDATGLDRLRWRMLRRRYATGGFDGDLATE